MDGSICMSELVMRACSRLKRKKNKVRDLSELVLHHFSRQCNAMLYVVPLDRLLDSTQLDLLSHQVGVGVGVAGAVRCGGLSTFYSLTY